MWDMAMNADVNDAIDKEPATNRPINASELLDGKAGDIDATTVSMERASARRITAERVTMDRSGAQRIETRSAQLDRSGALQLNSERAVLQNSSAWVVAAQEARLVKSKALAVVAGRVEGDGETRSLLFIGQSSGDVKTVIGPAGAAGLGVGLGFVFVLIKALARRISRS
jgi:hypothetical protein